MSEQNELCPHRDKDHIAKCGCLCQGTRKLDRLEAEVKSLRNTRQIIIESFARDLPDSRGITAFVDGVPTFEATFGDLHSIERLAIVLAKMIDPDARLIYTTEE